MSDPEDVREDFVKKGTSPGVGAALDRLAMRAWRFFISLKCGILLLCVIAAVSIYGTTTIAANSSFGDNAIPLAKARVFESRAFVSLMLIFAFQLTLSTWHVTKMSFGIWWKKAFQTSPSFYRHGSAPRAEVPVPGGAEEVQRVLERSFTRVHRRGDAFFAHRGLLSRIGPTIVHIGMLTVIFAQVARVVFIWTGASITEGRFIGGEGETVANIYEPINLGQQMTPENMTSVPLPFWIRINDFDEIKHPNSNVPAYFSSLIEVHDPRTQKVTVAQLDMNHSFAIDGLEFHQAGYQAVDSGSFPRTNFDVRNKLIDERIAVTDTSPGIRVRVGAEDLYLEVDGAEPGARWNLFRAKDPATPVAMGLLTGARSGVFSFEITEFFPHFGIDPETREPRNTSPTPHNPAARVSVFEDGAPIGTTWVFFDPSLNALVPPGAGFYSLRLDDVQIPRGTSVEELDWSDADQVRYVIAVAHRESGAVVTQASLGIGERSEPVPFEAGFTAPRTLGTEGQYEVRVIGPAQRFVTIFSVVSEPTVPWTNLGVALVVAGAMLTFVIRYRAFYGLWNEEAGTLSMALVPRWGQSPVREEFDRLVDVLSKGAGPIVALAGDENDDDFDTTAEQADEVAPKSMESQAAHARS